MADKYEVDIAMQFGSAGDALELRKAIEGPLAAGLTTLGDRYSVFVAKETGECSLEANLRFADSNARDKIATAAKKAKASAKLTAGFRIATHTCRHDAGGRGFGECANPVIDEGR